MLEAGDPIAAALGLPAFGLDGAFRDPMFLLGLILVPLVYLAAARLPASVTFSSLSIPDAGPESLRARLTKLPALLTALAAGAFVVGMAGPRTGDATSIQRRDGIAIAMVVDHSGSMIALDFAEGDQSKSRLDVVKQVFRDFVLGGNGAGGRADDLIGLIAFGTFADGLCPLTLDHANLVAILDDLEIARDNESGTAIGEGLALAVERLRQNPARSKVAILLTDGVNNAGDIAPLQAAELAAQFGVKVYAIGAGRTGPAPVPVRLPNGQVVLERRYVEIDEATLEAIAERTGGQYFHATDEDSLAKVIQQIDQLERTQISEVRYLQYEHHYAAFVGVGALFLALACVASGTWLRRLP